MRLLTRISCAVLVCSVFGATSLSTVANATGAMNSTCVVASATSCVATIPLVPNMDVYVTFLLPPNNGFDLTNFGGAGPAEFTSLTDGYWNGVGTSFTTWLQTPAAEPAGAAAVLTFVITPLTAPSTTSTVPTTIPKLPSAVTLSFAPKSFFLSAGAKSRLKSLAKKLSIGARVTFTGYAKSNPSLARNRALSTASYLYSLVKVYSKVVVVISKPLNRVKVVTTAL